MEIKLETILIPGVHIGWVGLGNLSNGPFIN